jgi:transposase
MTNENHTIMILSTSSKKINDLAEKVAAEILYLPPYCPDFNKTGHQWFAIKNRARRNIPYII